MPPERAYILLKNGIREFQNSTPFERSAWFYVAISGNFVRLQYFYFERDFLENENLFQKNGVPFFSWKHLDWKRIISIQDYHMRSQC